MHKADKWLSRTKSWSVKDLWKDTSVSWWRIEDALKAAYSAGFKAGTKNGLGNRP